MFCKGDLKFKSSLNKSGSLGTPTNHRFYVITQQAMLEPRRAEIVVFMYFPATSYSFSTIFTLTLHLSLY